MRRRHDAFHGTKVAAKLECNSGFIEILLAKNRAAKIAEVNNECFVTNE
jgi:hypothetical protein